VSCARQTLAGDQFAQKKGSVELLQPELDRVNAGTDHHFLEGGQTAPSSPTEAHTVISWHLPYPTHIALAFSNSFRLFFVCRGSAISNDLFFSLRFEIFHEGCPPFFPARVFLLAGPPLSTFLSQSLCPFFTLLHSATYHLIWIASMEYAC